MISITNWKIAQYQKTQLPSSWAEIQNHISRLPFRCGCPLLHLAAPKMIKTHQLSDLKRPSLDRDSTLRRPQSNCEIPGTIPGLEIRSHQFFTSSAKFLPPIPVNYHPFVDPIGASLQIRRARSLISHPHLCSQMSSALLQSTFAQRGVQRAFVSTKSNSRVCRVSAAKMTSAALSQDELKQQVRSQESTPARSSNPTLIFNFKDSTF
jgi:hypothetical protein